MMNEDGGDQVVQYGRCVVRTLAGAADAAGAWFIHTSVRSVCAVVTVPTVYQQIISARRS